MRNHLNNMLEILVWIVTFFQIVAACLGGAYVIRYVNIAGGFVMIAALIAVALLVAGLCFQIMDIREFTKHSAISLKRMSQR